MKLKIYEIGFIRIAKAWNDFIKTGDCQCSSYKNEASGKISCRACPLKTPDCCFGSNNKIGKLENRKNILNTIVDQHIKIAQVDVYNMNIDPTDFGDITYGLLYKQQNLKRWIDFASNGKSCYQLLCKHCPLQGIDCHVGNSNRADYRYKLLNTEIEIPNDTKNIQQFIDNFLISNGAEQRPGT